MLADSLRLIVSQVLLRTGDGSGRIAAAEVLVNTHAVASMIRSGNTHKLESLLQTGAGSGMQSLDTALRKLVENAEISGEEAHLHAFDKSLFERFVARREMS